MLTEEQIQSLFNFCYDHSVEYYEVQLELVDHLANAIESEMKANPTITFAGALEKVYHSFGYNGFKPLVIEKQKIAKNQSRRLFWQLFKSQFRWPKILLFILLTTGMVTIFTMEIFLIKILLGIMLILSLVVVLYVAYLQKIVSDTGRKFLIANISWILSLLLLPSNLLCISRLYKDESIFSYTPAHILIPGMSIFLSLNIILMIVTWQTLNSIKRTLYKNYPEVFSTVK